MLCQPQTNAILLTMRALYSWSIADLLNVVSASIQSVADQTHLL